MKDLRAFRELLGFVAPFRLTYAWALSALFLQYFLLFRSAYLLGDVVDQGLVRGSGRALASGLVWLVGTQLLSLACGYVGKRGMVQAGLSAIRHLRQRLFAKVGELPLQYFQRGTDGRVVTLLTNDVESLEGFFTGTLVRLSVIVVGFSSLVGSALVVDRRIGYLVLAGALPALFCAQFSRRWLRPRETKYAEQNADLNALLGELTSGLDTIHQLGLFAWAARRLSSTLRVFRENGERIILLSSFWDPVVVGLCMVPVLLVFGWEGPAVLAGSLPLGAFIAHMKVAQEVIQPVQALAFELQGFQSLMVSTHRLTGFLQEATESQCLGLDGRRMPARWRGRLEFRNVSMAYLGREPVLSGVSLEVRAGEIVGFVGKTGAGKSTLLALLPRLYEYQQGEIFLDGISLRELPRHELRTRIGYVSQDPLIFSASLEDNLTLGQPISRSVLESTLVATGFDEIMRRRNWTLDSQVGEAGKDMSAGEAQLLGLTRVFLRDPALLILDESLSSIDSELQSRIKAALRMLMYHRTTLIIAHRLEDLAPCSRIFRVFDHRVVEVVPGELVAQDLPLAKCEVL